MSRQSPWQYEIGQYAGSSLYSTVQYSTTVAQGCSGGRRPAVHGPGHRRENVQDATREIENINVVNLFNIVDAIKS